MEGLLEKDGLQEKLLSGAALFSIKNTEKNTHRTFKIQKRNKSVFWVTMLTKPNNDTDESYLYIGHINTAKRKLKTTSKVFKWFWLHLAAETLPDEIEVYHANKCLKCGRTLTTPSSVVRGLGPICAGK